MYVMVSDFVFLCCFFCVCLLCFFIGYILVFCFLIACFFSKERDDEGGWVVRWGESGRRWSRRNQDQNILYKFSRKKKIFKILKFKKQALKKE